MQEIPTLDNDAGSDIFLMDQKSKLKTSKKNMLAYEEFCYVNMPSKLQYIFFKGPNISIYSL